MKTEGQNQKGTCEFNGNTVASGQNTTTNTTARKINSFRSKICC